MMTWRIHRTPRCPRRTPQAMSAPTRGAPFRRHTYPYSRAAARKGGPMARNSAEPGRSVTSKVVAILLTFHDGDEHSLTEIARLTGLPVSTAHRLVTELAGWGLLERTDELQFRVGLRIRAIGGRASYSPGIIESARRVLEDLAIGARMDARLGILTGTRVTYIQKRFDHSPVTT